MESADALLLAALDAAPRPYRMPPLPADAQSARAAGVETAVAFAIEQARLASADGTRWESDRADDTRRDSDRGHGTRWGSVPAQGTALEPSSGARIHAARSLFLESLAELIRSALSAEGGDPAFQALVLRAREPHVAEHVRLSSLLAADRRAVRAVVDAFAHPGKLRASEPGPLRESLARLHTLASEGAWHALRTAVEELIDRDDASDAADGLDGADAAASGDAGIAHRRALRALIAHPALQRLARAEALLQDEAVRRYQALCAQLGPPAGSEAATAQGRTSARAGDEAERTTVECFEAVVALLNAHTRADASYRVLRSLRVPPGFRGEASKSKDEWDAAIVRRNVARGAAFDIVLLAEVKASPAAATPDFSRLHRGLQRLALAQPGEIHTFPSAAGEVTVTGESLRALQPRERALPPHVVYCSAATDTLVQMLSAATKAVLLAEPASIAFAQALLDGRAPAADALLPAWEALPAEPRLRSALFQYDTARAVREAMIRPLDLLEEVRRRA